jgi:PAS domain S-box-containing protein
VSATSGLAIPHEDLYRVLFESAEDAIFTMDGDRFTDCNASTLRMFRCAREEIVGQTPYRFSPPSQPDGGDSKAAALARIEAALAGQPQRFEWLHRRLDGGLFHAGVTLNCYQVGKRRYLMAAVRDISDTKQAAAKLQEASTLHELVLRSLPMAFYVARASGEFGGLWVSEQITSLSGYTPGQFAADPGLWAARLHPEDREETLATFDRLADHGNLRVTYRWQTAGGAYRWFEDNPVLVRDEQGETAHIIGTWLDVTKQKTAREELR